MSGSTQDTLDPRWIAAISPHCDPARLETTLAAVRAARDTGKAVYPPPGQVFAALNHAPPGALRAVILGQDPYIRPGQAHGYAFSVPHGVKPPPSLRNVLKELATDLGITPSGHGCLTRWADQGVLLLNTILTVEEGKSLSHRDLGWSAFTDAVIRAASDQRQPIAFLLWGGPAGAKAALVDAGRHLILRAAHPSPLAQGRFFGARPFSQANAWLASHGTAPIDWRLGD